MHLTNTFKDELTSSLKQYSLMNILQIANVLHFIHFMWLYTISRGAQWLSGRVLDSRPKGSGFEPHRRHCVVVLEQDTFILA